MPDPRHRPTFPPVIALHRPVRNRAVYAGVCMLLAIWLLGLDMQYMATKPVHDVFIYQCYARGFWQGPQQAAASDAALTACRPFWIPSPTAPRTLPIEYPAPALAVFSLPLLTPWISYDTAFVLWMSFLLLLAAAGLALRGPPWSAAALLLYVLVAGWPFFLERYDLAPGLAVLLALVFAGRGRYRSSAAMLAVGALLKGVPLLLLPALLLAARRETGIWRRDVLLVFAGVCVLALLPFALVSPQALWSPVSFAMGRPLHLESLPGLVVWFGSAFTGSPHLDTSYNSCNVVGNGQSLVSALSSALFVLGIGVAYWRQWRGRDSLARSCILILMVALVTNKVFSPQYLLWLFPAVAFGEGLDPWWVALAVVTSFSFAATGQCSTGSPHTVLSLRDLASWDQWLTLKLLARDLLLCSLAVAYLLRRGERSGVGWRRGGVAGP